MFRRRALLLAIAILALSILVACQPTTIEVTREVAVEKEVTVEVPVEVETTVEVPVEVETTVEVPVEVTREVIVEQPIMEEPVTLSGYSTTDIPTLDPQRGEDTVSIGAIENLFVHLTNYDLETTEIVSEAATSWEVSDDGLVYTFKIRNDIPCLSQSCI
jgi:ABC-type transport system substrate-binding protein